MNNVRVLGNISERSIENDEEDHASHRQNLGYNVNEEEDYDSQSEDFMEDVDEIDDAVSAVNILGPKYEANLLTDRWTIKENKGKTVGPYTKKSDLNENYASASERSNQQFSNTSTDMSTKKSDQIAYRTDHNMFLV